MSLVSPYGQESFSKARWIMPSVPLEDVHRLAVQHDLPEFLAQMLLTRGIKPEDVERFLNPTLKSDLPDPFTLQGMPNFAAFFADAIMDKRKIAIFADFDVDGATSSALMCRFLRHCGIEARIYIPERLTEGYGPNNEALKTLKDEGAEVLLMLDCGTTAFDTLAYGKEIGLQICVLDHHEAEDRLPDVAHLINPKRKDDTSGLDVLAAVGVTFMACVATNAVLRDRGFYKNGPPPLREWLDLVTFGTVCDVVPLTGVNRVLTRAGFPMMNRTRNTGLLALMAAAQVRPPLDPYHLGYVLGPRVNAGSRVDRSYLGARLLATDDPEEAAGIAATLEACNEKRKALQDAMEAQAVEMVESGGHRSDPLILLSHRDWHSGLSGIVASRVKEKYGRPACIVAYVENEHGEIEARGSGRSIAGVHLAQAFISARAAGLVIKGGGHAMAGGFTAFPDRLKDLRAFLNAHVSAQLQSALATITTQIDGYLTVKGAQPEFVRMLHERAGPFGQEYPEPLFMFQNVRLRWVETLKEKHIRVDFSGWEEGGPRMKGMAFSAVDTPLGSALLKHGAAAPINLLGHVVINEWNGRQKVELRIKDAAPCMANNLDFNQHCTF